MKQKTLHSLLCLLLVLSFQTVKSQTKTNSAERYLMITAPEYENTLTYFANYKRNIGFDVQVVTTNTTGKTPESIKKYIQNQYNNIKTRPVYLLLVGDVDKIPAYEGDPSGTDKNNPISDLGYSLLEGKDYFADLYLGRFSVSNNEELKNIIHKTIFMEVNMRDLTKKAKFIAGDDKKFARMYMKTTFKQGHEYAIRHCFEPSGYLCEKLYQPDKITALKSFADQPLFYLYAGHGSFNALAGNSFEIARRDLTHASHTVFPVVFAFACKTGDFAHPKYVSMAEACIREKKGAVAYYGASVNTTTDSDVVIEKEIFGKPFSNEIPTLSAWINAGMKLFYKSYITNRKTIRNLKSYNLLGDPSLNLTGVVSGTNHVISYSDTLQNEIQPPTIIKK